VKRVADMTMEQFDDFMKSDEPLDMTGPKTEPSSDNEPSSKNTKPKTSTNQETSSTKTANPIKKRLSTRVVETIKKNKGKTALAAAGIGAVGLSALAYSKRKKDAK
jgi:hypothetical protein